MSKRIISLVLALVMVLGTFSFTFAEEPENGLTDNEKVNWLIQEGLVEGDEGTGDLRLADPIKRSEVAKMVVLAQGKGELAKSLETIERFPDVLTSPADKWANGYINVAAADGIVTGYEDGTFRPGNNITKAEAIAMMVRVAGGLSPEEQKLAVGKNWAAPYLIKAHELGILEGVELGNANEAATREFVFEIVYNTIHTADSGRYSIVKAIVLENYRVENLDKDEVVVEVISEIQKSKFADESRRIEGAQYSLIIPENVGDVEDLLGKVANITVEGEIRDGAEAVRVVVDDTYKYAVGAITSVGKNRIVVNYSDRYTVELPERYDKSDERIFRTYYNNESFAYEDFVEEEVYPEFARITVKNGKVLFIDAFDFDDIAPVQEVRNDGRVVYVYNDEADGALKKLEFNSRTNVIIIDGTKMSVGSLEDIEAMDVVHYIADENTVFVRVDAEVEGVYEKASSTTIEGVSIVNIFVDGEAYAALTKTPYRKAVYTYNLEDFATLEGSPSYIDERLSAYKDEEVVLLLDMNDNVQYIAAEVKDTHFVAMIKDILGTEVELELVDGEEEVYKASLKRSTLIAYDSEGHSLKEGRLEAFNKGDLVRVLLDDEGYIAKLVKLADNDIDNEVWVNEDYAGYYDRIATGEAVLTGNLRYNKARGAFAGEENEFYYVNKNTVVFIYTGGEPTATTMSEVLKNYKLFDADGNPLDDVQGYIIYDEEVPGKENLAKVVVFTAIEPVGPAYDTIVRKFVRHEYTGGKNYIVVEDTAGESKTHEVANRSAVLGLAAGDIVELEVTKNDAQVVTSATILIDASEANVYRVDRRSGRRITLEDANGDKLTFWLSTVANEFGEIEADARVQIDLEGEDLVENGLITNIVSTTQGLRGTFEETEDEDDDDEVESDGELAYAFTVGDTLIRVKIDGVVKSYNVVEGSLVVDKNDQIITEGTFEAGTKVNIVLVEGTSNVDIIKFVEFEVQE